MTLGLKSFYESGSPDVKAEVAPLVPEVPLPPGTAFVLTPLPDGTYAAQVSSTGVLIKPEPGGGYRATVSYGERLVSWPTEKHARFVFIRDFLVPNFHCGVLAAGAERVGGKSVKAVGRQTGPLEAVYDITWE